MADNNAAQPYSASDDPLIGVQLGDYVIERLIGRGGMAHVYEGFDQRLDRRAAIKVIHNHGDHSDSSDGDSEEELKQRFFREARAIAKLDHPNIVVVYQFGEGPHVYYLAMKLIDGQTLLSELKKLRKRKKFLDQQKTLKVMTQIGSAVDYAHSRGIIHRDIKPSNIMLTEDGRAILMDFGLTLQADTETTMGTAFGTPRYIAPEQAIASQRAVPQSDIYSLGVVLYEMITGQTPFDSDSPMSLALSHITNPVPSPSSVRSDITPAVELVILKALEKRPENRWQTAAAMVEALRKAYDGIAPAVTLTSLPYDVLPDSPVPTASIDPTELRAPEVSPISSREADITPANKASVKSAAASPRSKQRSRWLLLTMLLISLVVVGGGLLTVSTTSPPAQTTPIPVISPTVSARLRLLYSGDSLAIYNASGRQVSLENLSFVHGTSRFDLAHFVDPASTGYKTFLDGQCLRIQKSSASDMPDKCGLQNAPVALSNPGDVFWSAHDPGDTVTTFAIKQGDQTLQTCLISLNTCEFMLP